MLDRDLLIDLGPDSIQALLHSGIDPSGMRFLLQTHPHQDHFDQNHLATRLAEYGGRVTAPLQVIASRGTLNRMTRMLQGMGFDGDLLTEKSQAELGVKVQVIEHGQTLALGQRQVTAFNANHDSEVECLIYAVRQGQSCLLYATDTDTLPEETVQAMQRVKLVFSTVVMDHTYGPGSDGGGHLNAVRFQQTVQDMRKAALLHERTRVYATHTNRQKSGFTEGWFLSNAGFGKDQSWKCRRRFQCLPESAAGIVTIGITCRTRATPSIRT